MADDIVTRLQCTYPSGEWPCEECTFCVARAEIERLRAQVEELLPLFEDIVIGERIRERAANDNGRRTPLGEVAADFGIDLTLDEIERLQAIVATVDDLHSCRLAHDTCLACYRDWPCPTHLLIHPEEARRG